MENLELFLRESNAIEDVWDEQSLVDARKAWDYLIQFDALTKENILKCHDILMEHHLPQEQRGCFRNVRVWVGGSEGEGVDKVEPLFKMWLLKARGELLEAVRDKRFSDLEKQLHIEFEHIHPFIDGNGRTGRIILNWMRVKTGKTILVIHEATKRYYYEWFRV